MQHFKQTITKIPTYLDGKFRLFDLIQSTELVPEDKLHDTEKEMYYKELSITDRLKIEASQRQLDILLKIRIPQTREITSLNVIKIGEKYYKVFNPYHFTDDDGFEQTDLTLEYYPNPILEVPSE